MNYKIVTHRPLERYMSGRCWIFPEEYSDDIMIARIFDTEDPNRPEFVQRFKEFFVVTQIITRDRVSTEDPVLAIEALADRVLLELQKRRRHLPIEFNALVKIFVDRGERDPIVRGSIWNLAACGRVIIDHNNMISIPDRR